MPFDFDMDSISPIESGGGGSGGETIITAENLTGSAISAGDKVWINEDNDSYEIITFNTDTSGDFTVVGAPTITNKVASGFSYANYLLLPNNFKPGSSSWKIVFKINVPTHQEVNFISWFSVSSSDSGRFGVSFGLSNDTLYTMMSSNGYSWDLSFQGSSHLSTNTDYWIKLEYDTTKYIMSYSTDGVNYTTDAVQNNSTPVYNNINNTLIGGYNIFYGGDNTPFNGYLDLDESYIEIDGDKWWVPYQPVISQDSITGIAKENIAISGTGDVAVGVVEATGTISITENGTYNVKNYASANVNVAGGSSGKYQLLERVKDDNNNEIGTVSGFFTDANNVEYAVVCLDAQYRLAEGTYCGISSAVTDLPMYSGWAVWEAKETATFNTQKILDFCTAQSTTSTACSHCRSKSFTIEGTTYYGQLPNIVELVDICKNYTAIQSADTSVSQYSSLGLPRTSERTWSSTQNSNGQGWTVQYNGTVVTGNKINNQFVAPVLEIPNT